VLIKWAASAKISACPSVIGIRNRFIPRCTIRNSIKNNPAIASTVFCVIDDR
jgi:hypothetical protein